MEERELRIADNESLFRQVNERVVELHEELSVDQERLEFLCECGRGDCAEKIVLSRGDYEAVRSEPTTFAIVGGHEFPDVEEVVARHEGWVVVRKHPGEAADRVAAHDPRS